MDVLESLPMVDLIAGSNSAGLNLRISRATEKVHTRLDLLFEFDDPTVDGNGQKILPEASWLLYKSTLIGTTLSKTTL